MQVKSHKKIKLSVNQPQGRFILGSELSTSADSSFLRSPTKSRWSSIINTRNSPAAKSPFSQIRNRSYVLSLSPHQQQQQSPTRKNTRLSKSKRVIDFTGGHKGLNSSLRASLTSAERSGGEENVSTSHSRTRKSTEPGEASKRRSLAKKAKPRRWVLVEGGVTIVILSLPEIFRISKAMLFQC